MLHSAEHSLLAILRQPISICEKRNRPRECPVQFHGSVLCGIWQKAETSLTDLAFSRTPLAQPVLLKLLEILVTSLNIEAVCPRVLSVDVPKESF